MSESPKFNFNFLQKYCEKNNIELLEDYSNIALKGDTFINGKCIYENCQNSFEKKFSNVIKTGAYCKKCILHKNKKDINQEFLTKYSYESLQNFCLKNNIVLLKNYICDNLHQKFQIEGKCYNKECSNNFKTSFQNLYIRFGFCMSCSKLNRIVKTKETFLLNYGCDNPNKIQEIRDKIYNTNLKKYGHIYLFKSEEVKNKIKTKMLQKYGVSNPQQNVTIKQKTENTCLNKYGVKNPIMNCEIKSKAKNTILKKYGVEYASQNEDIKEKIIQTNLVNWGVKNPTQNAEIAEKASNNCYKTKTFIMPSGKNLKCQGYEPFALKDLINLNIVEDDIISEKTKVPEIWFKDKNNKEHRYYVDIYIPSQNKCIEVKSIYTYKKNETINLLKKKAAIELGYNFEFWIYDRKGNKISI
jgi:hypothetical protein